MEALKKNNLTLQILAAAEEGGYGVIAQCVYDIQSVVALVRACESARSPAILQLFPITMRQFGPLFVKYCIDAAHAASVPISVHVDHAQEDEDIKWILEELAEKQHIKVDSIMIDASHADNDESSIKQAKPFVDKAVSLGIAVEVELGRLSGGEGGIKTADEAILTKPEKAKHFLSELQASMLAPCVGNMHGNYPSDPVAFFKLDLLSELDKAVGYKTPSNAHLVLHGTDDLPDHLFTDCIKRGTVKINVNSWTRNPQLNVWAQEIPKQTALPDVYELGMQVFEKNVKRFFDLFGSTGKA
ncbi:aldolase [Tilletiaria anomala UBC 951]|uniref:Fructose-bisphosphate aldolase n=1 Tax=Tilletiaria anomala (strain ATCC 24038 / CBS 436.72 / UBC 951) TaxID=1037660 RepID=A0A066VHN0_TILAU|nr:aldolase [Tilletiaria anomala UBC 951]KDN41232.1 aldolase [Tilletiaria anomala UBC 951]